ncbi:hypothetical protein AVEN_225227-2 [Araneus ventricosus]|uniref:Uncharacterized protein n=1 Tax=Araneus ventricosus TaxID=182803 RepID=A0A4Y2AL97_ARAVE|nr:hypothetical protein AVEN_225227-2 [Araneus ventricosus]
MTNEALDDLVTPADRESINDEEDTAPLTYKEFSELLKKRHRNSLIFHWRLTQMEKEGPIHCGSSVESGFEPGTLRSRSRHLTIIGHRDTEVTVKRLSETRWSAHYEAVKPMFKCFKKIVDAIEELYYASETIETRGSTLLPSMCDFSFLSFLCLWNNVLKEDNHVQNYLQILGISFYKSVIEMRSLKDSLKDKRCDLVEEALEFAKDTCEDMWIPIIKRRAVRRKKIIPAEKAADEPLTLDQKLKRSMLE